MRRYVALVVVVAFGLLAQGAEASHSVLVKPDRIKVLTCDPGTYNAASAEIFRGHQGKREWMLLGKIGHPGGNATVGRYTRQGGGGSFARLYSSPSGDHMVIANQGDHGFKVKDTCKS